MKISSLVFASLTLLSASALAEANLQNICGQITTKLCKLSAQASEEDVFKCVEKHENKIKKSDKPCYDAHEDYEKAQGKKDND